MVVNASLKQTQDAVKDKAERLDRVQSKSVARVCPLASEDAADSASLKSQMADLDAKFTAQLEQITLLTAPIAFGLRACTGQIAAMRGEIDTRFCEVNGRLANHDQKFSSMDAKINEALMAILGFGAQI